MAVHVLRRSLNARQHRVTAHVFLVEYRHLSPTHDEIVLLELCGSQERALTLVMVRHRIPVATIERLLLIGALVRRVCGRIMLERHVLREAAAIDV